MTTNSNHRSPRLLYTGRGAVRIALLVATFWMPPAFAAEPFPVRPVQVIGPFASSGSVDAMARYTSAALSLLLGQQFIVVNREGASGTIGFTQLAHARPDGYTLGFGPTTPISIAPHMMKDIKYGAESFEYICQVFENVFLIAVPRESPFRSITDLVAAARASPGKLTYGNTGIGTVGHLSVANFLYRSGLDAVSVPYRTNFLPDLLSGRLSFGALTVAQIAGREDMRVLAVFADRRHPAHPDAPTFAELNMPSMPPGLNGLYAPKGTPREVLATLERACASVTESEPLRMAGQRLNAPILYLNGAAFSERAQTDFRYKGELIRALKITAE